MKKAIVEKLTALITAAFGLVAALAWNEAIKAIFAAYIKPVFGPMGEMWSMLAYAVVLTFIAVISTILISKLAPRKKKV